MTFTHGLQFKKVDLHVHTPASDDFNDKTATAKEIVDAALAKGLAGIAITDHQTGAFIDLVKKEAKDKNLIVFPGVELKVHGGESGVHILVLFDVDKSGDYVKAFLNTLKVYEHNGKPDVIANCTAIDVARELQEFDRSGVMVLAHCHSTQGVLGDMRGQQRSEIFKPEWRCLMGAEARETDFTDSEKIRRHTRVVDLFDGGYDGYHYKKLGVYQSSDAHSLAEIGTQFTYFKVDDVITIDDIRQSLCDRDTRIRHSFEFKELIYPQISRLEVRSGFLNDQDFEFHEGLNSLLGAKGSGKSLVIEFLRFALDQEPMNPDILSDHRSKLEKCLKLHGQVEVLFIDDSGKGYLIKRTYRPSDSNPIEVTDVADGTKKDFAVSHIFPVLFLSQNEIIKIAEDKTGASQREFIDKFFDFRSYQFEVARLNKELAEVDSRFAEVIKAHLARVELQKTLVTYKEEIEKLGRRIENTVFAKYSSKEQIGQLIRTELDFVDSLKDTLATTHQEYSDISIPALADQTNADPAVKRAAQITSDILKEIVRALDELKSMLNKKRVGIQEEYDQWKSNFAAVKEEFESVVKQAGGTQVALDEKRKTLINESSKMQKELTRYEGRAQQAKTVAEKRKQILDQLDDAYKAYSEARGKRCDYFTAHSFGKLEVTIKENEDKTSFKNNLLRLKRGSWLREEDIETISGKISPREFIEEMLRFAWSSRLKKEPLDNIAKTTGIKVEGIEKLAEHLLDEYEFKELLALLYTSAPNDVPTIKLKVGTDFKRLDELSVGQKAIALLIIALSDGAFPIVIDQPEDSLDLKTIWEDVCQKLRMSKDRRQFILTTHNSSVAVASDTDRFTILQSDATQGKIMFSGSMNRGDIRKEVIDYLEGGEGTYNQKRQKYDL